MNRLSPHPDSWNPVPRAPFPRLLVLQRPHKFHFFVRPDDPRACASQRGHRLTLAARRICARNSDIMANSRQHASDDSSRLLFGLRSAVHSRFAHLRQSAFPRRTCTPRVLLASVSSTTRWRRTRHTHQNAHPHSPQHYLTLSSRLLYRPFLAPLEPAPAHRPELGFLYPSLLRIDQALPLATVLWRRRRHM